MPVWVAMGDASARACMYACWVSMCICVCVEIFCCSKGDSRIERVCRVERQWQFLMGVFLVGIGVRRLFFHLVACGRNTRVQLVVVYFNIDPRIEAWTQ